MRKAREPVGAQASRQLQGLLCGNSGESHRIWSKMQDYVPILPETDSMTLAMLLRLYLHSSDNNNYPLTGFVW